VLYFEKRFKLFKQREIPKKKETIGGHFEFIVKHVLHDETFFSFILDQGDQSTER